MYCSGLFFVAQEVMTDADTHLMETKDVFEKTKLYFMYDNPQVCVLSYFFSTELRLFVLV